MHSNKSFSGFTLIELLIVIAVVGVMSALIVAAISNSAADSRMVLARQQQAVLQEALNAWITRQASLSAARTSYSGASDKLALFGDYLDPTTRAHFAENSTSTQIKSEAAKKLGVYFRFSSWASATNFPQVDMIESASP